MMTLRLDLRHLLSVIEFSNSRENVKEKENFIKQKIKRTLAIFHHKRIFVLITSVGKRCDVNCARKFNSFLLEMENYETQK